MDLFLKYFGRVYSKFILVFFSGQIVFGCGCVNVNIGLFYCFVDQKFYIDLSFY